ncbi:MAG: putative oxidoreductase [Granulosicoccus sp.]|jgi:predicted oxidoreductase
MRKIALSTDGAKASRLLFGTRRLANDTDTSLAMVIKKINICLEQGITTFDHADIYGNCQCK